MKKYSSASPSAPALAAPSRLIPPRPLDDELTAALGQAAPLEARGRTVCRRVGCYALSGNGGSYVDGYAGSARWRRR